MIHYNFIGWCKEDKHDKVWGIVLLRQGRNAPWFEPNQYATFWGRRGAKLQTKIWQGTDWDAREMFRKKENKGYKSIMKSDLDSVYPDFESDLEKTAVWAMLKA